MEKNFTTARRAGNASSELPICAGHIPPRGSARPGRIGRRLSEIFPSVLITYAAPVFSGEPHCSMEAP
jgi:hypothetical protein